MYDHQWSTGLLQLSSLPHYAMAAVCPCNAVYTLNRSHEWSARGHSDPVLSCFLASLSVCTVAPACVCADQFATRTIDGALLAHSVSSTSEPSFVSSLLSTVGYGGGDAEAHWAHDERGYDLAESFAYSDSHTDLPMLEVVGNPVAVNPDTELRKIATERAWPIVDFAKPVAMREQATKRQAVAAGSAVALGAVALGITWYARRRGLRA